MRFNLNGSVVARSIVPPCTAARRGRKWRAKPARPSIARWNQFVVSMFIFLDLHYFPWASYLLPSRPEDSPDHKAPVMASATPTAGLRAEFLDEIAYYQQRYMRLAEAMPVEKYTWRPTEGVRSVGEVFTHITAANYGIAGHWVPPHQLASISRPSRPSAMPASRKKCSTIRPPCADPSS